MSPTSPSPISSYRGHCVRPQEGSCSPKDGSYVIFSKQGECTEDFMEFSLDEEGVLRHQCSGKMVCPEGGSTSRGAKLTVSNACDKEASKFERTAGESRKVNGHHYANPIPDSFIFWTLKSLERGPIHHYVIQLFANSTLPARVFQNCTIHAFRSNEKILHRNVD